MTHAEMIKKYLEIKDYIEREQKAFDEKTEPYTKAMSTIANHLLEVLNTQGGQSIKTDFGTAYKATSMAAKVVDREEFYNFVFDHRAHNYLTAAVSKDAVKEFMEINNGLLPPGIEISNFTKVNIRRS